MARWLRSRHPTVKLLLMSAEYDGDSVQAQEGTTDVRFIAKPFKGALLALTVQDLLSD
jgi:hypothetical protein